MFFTRFLILMIAILLSYIILSKPLLLEDTDFSRIVLDRNKKLMRLTISVDQKYRLYTSLDNIAPQFIEAVLLYEDKYFYSHIGINPIALYKAFVQTYFGGNRKVGGSTITMQVARLKFKIKSSNVLGKIWQIVKALQLELHYSKKDILEAYLNLVPYGRNIEGVGAASYIYLGRQAQDLNLFESLSLAVIPQNPLKRAPNSGVANNKTLLARKFLFEQWQELHPQDKVYNKLFDLPAKFNSIQDLPFIAPQFTLRMLATNNHRNITTTIDKEIQNFIARQLEVYVNTSTIYGIKNAAALLIDFTTMEVLASVGSANFSDVTIQGQIDGTRTRRSPGSTLKPFVYALAFDQGLIHPLTLLKDTPYNYGNYLPENFDGDFIGPISAKDALIKSKNVPVLYLASKLFNPTFYEFLKKSGVGKLLPVDKYGLSLALGGVEVTMEELVKLYAMLANMGVYQELKKVTEVQPNNFGISSLLSPEASYITLDILKSVARPGLNANMLGSTAINLSVYWKTGTSSAFRDSWAVGIFGKYVLAVWVGDFQGKVKGQFIGVKTAAPLFFNIIDSLTGISPIEDLISYKVPSLKITKVLACADTGDIDNDLCPIKTDSWFIPGKSPIKPSGIYRKQERQLTSKNNSYQINKFWSSDLNQISINKNLLSATTSVYGISSNSYQKPEITSPLKNVVYSLKVSKFITFSAITDANVATLFWFVDDQFIAKTYAAEFFLWQATIGKKIIRVIDNNGYSHTRVIIVEN
ncbi:penicillin-binding protein 1C [Candidatus Trichorickettsia mobilis]|uniref:penicillin-binding protein 1C n=1 Tax=Candidatus Trichorickettsia mobilis TaxID=1346319 RepID=UPI00292D7443|nr:penicillin-binding protein 1C [Candidatus Trichorickettsia mobilis]